MTESELIKKYFPHVPWTALGPVRRRYLAKPSEGSASVQEALLKLAKQEGFVEPEQQAVTGNAEACLAAFQRKPKDPTVGMIFGAETGAFWCDIACGKAEEDGFQELIVRSEEGENLTALAYNKGILQFKKLQK